MFTAQLPQKLDKMKTAVGILAFGLCLELALCQINPAMMAMLGQGGMSGMGGMAMMPGMGMEMNDILQYQMMSNMGRSGGSAGSAGSGSSSAGGSGMGMDPTSLMLLSGGGLGGGMSNDLMQQMMMMNMMNQNPDQGQGQAQGQGQGQGQAQGGGIYSRIAGMLGDMGSGISPAQQGQMWTYLTMKQLTERIMSAVSDPTGRVQLERDGILTAPDTTTQMMIASMCPRPTGCMMPFCGETAEIPFTPESFYMCRGCPRCRLDTSQQSMMNMMSQFRGNRGGASGGAGGNMAQQMAMMRMMQGGSGGGGGASNPMLTMALLNSMNQQSQTPTAPTSSQQSPPPPPGGPMFPPRGPPAATGNSASTGGGSAPPPEFVNYMQKIRAQMKQQNQAAKTARGSAPNPAA
ncbi:RNA-binding protein FUS-like isoform X2 [Mya arenaria]|uniref:RNA-binding protein FUS-like isoform X2 n=1 Tax=Mya arenaria TaxID=6604 RepID=UPI0022E40702|nr:RNA-binding protein FUS-like isoform X2 [Mya arenaria]